MKNTFGNSISVTIFGESHGYCIGAVLDGLPAGLEIDRDYIGSQLEKRRPFGKISTSRAERDEFQIVSGCFNGKTCGTPLTIIIPNENTRSGDYDYGRARPGHADYTAYIRYAGNEDYRGGGHFSGRVTAALTAAGALLQHALSKKGVLLATHILECAGVRDRGFEDFDKDFTKLNGADFAALDDKAALQMQEQILAAKNDGDSVGGILETVITGMPAGVGDPWFDSVEGMLSHALFSVPAVKGVEFGDGFALAKMRGSQANDPFYIENGKAVTAKNSNGGINGGITNGMPIVIRAAIKPTPTIFKEQQTINFIKNENTTLAAKGRHDPCIVHRARTVIDNICAITIADLLATRFSADFLR
jgi:chorismate synthase